MKSLTIKADEDGNTIDDECEPGKDFVRNGIEDQNGEPIGEIKAMIRHMTDMMMWKGLNQCVNHLRGRRLRIATMCSGTESPILTLTIVSECKSKPPLTRIGYY